MIEKVIGVDLGGTNIRGAVVDTDGNIQLRLESKTPRTGSADDIAGAVVGLINDLKAFDPNIAGVGLGLAAVVNIRRNHISNSANLQQLDGFDFASVLSGRTGLPVILENDATAATIGEHWLGGGKGSEHMICITLGTGVGGGVIANGKVIYGADGNAGEIGHICMDPDGPPCGCGSNGCLEQYASAVAIARLIREGLPSNPGSRLNKIADITPKDVFEAGVANDPFALSIFTSFGRWLGIALGGLVNVFNPEVMVITGGVSAAWDLFIGETLKQVRQRAWKQPAERAKIVRGQLHGDAGILGAAKKAIAHANKGSL